MTQSLQTVCSGIPLLVTLVAQAAVFLHIGEHNYKYTTSYISAIILNARKIQSLSKIQVKSVLSTYSRINFSLSDVITLCPCADSGGQT